MKQFKKRQNYTSKQNLTYLVLLVLLIIFFATVGLRFVINASLYIAGFRNNTQQEQTQSDNDILLAPELFNIPDATNSARITVSGTAHKGDSITTFVNNEEQETFTLDEDDFEASLILTKGNNTIFARSENKEGNRTEDSETYIIYYLSEKPTLTIDSPQDGTKINNNEILVQGTTSQDTSIKINNLPVVVSGDGKFTYSVRIKEGENIIRVVATDVAGNEEVKEIKVIYEKD